MAEGVLRETRVARVVRTGEVASRTDPCACADTEVLHTLTIPGALVWRGAPATAVIGCEAELRGVRRHTFVFIGALHHRVQRRVAEEVAAALVLMFDALLGGCAVDRRLAVERAAVFLLAHAQVRVGTPESALVAAFSGRDGRAIVSVPAFEGAGRGAGR